MPPLAGEAPRLLSTTRILLKSTSSFSGVLTKFARTAVNKEEGGIKGAWSQLMEPLPQRSHRSPASTMDEKIRQVDPMWLEELHKRQKSTTAPHQKQQQQSDGSGSAEEMQDNKFEAQPWVQQTLLETDTRAQEMGLFAYPSASSGWRVLPLGSITLLLATFAVSIELGRLISIDDDSVSIEDFHERSEAAMDYVDSVAASKECLTDSPTTTGVTSLLSCSLLHPPGDSTRSSRVVEAAVLLTTGAIMERLYGPLQFLGAVTLTTGLSNYIGLKLSGTELPLMGTSPAVFFGVGYLGIARPFSMWAILPNIPIPCLWLMAPATVSLATRAWRLLGSRSKQGEEEELTAANRGPYKDLSDRELRRLTSEVAVELSMMESVDESQDAARSVSTLYSPGLNRSELNASLVSLQDRLDDLRAEWSARGGWPSDRYAAFISDFAAMLLGLGCALATRGRFRGKFPTT